MICMKKIILIALILLLIAQPALATVPIVQLIQNPIDDKIEIILNVTHPGQSQDHFVDKIELYSGEKLIASWVSNETNYVKADSWQIKTQIPAQENLLARAHCTQHGWSDQTGFNIGFNVWYTLAAIAIIIVALFLIRKFYMK